MVTMTKRLVDITDDLLHDASEALGTSTIKETVASALEQAVRDGRRRSRVDEKALLRFAEATPDLADEEMMKSAWR